MVILTKICAAISTVVQVRYDTVPVSGTNEPYLYYSMISVVDCIQTLRILITICSTYSRWIRQPKVKYEYEYEERKSASMSR